jgi:hypothetical protein
MGGISTAGMGAATRPSVGSMCCVNCASLTTTGAYASIVTVAKARRPPILLYQPNIPAAESNLLCRIDSAMPAAFRRTPWCERSKQGTTFGANA